MTHISFPQADNQYLRAILDAIPAAVMVVDADVCILDYNEAAACYLGQDPPRALGRRCGDILKCLSALSNPDGCGHGPECGSCVIRLAVADSLKGRRTVRAKHRLMLSTPDGNTESFFLVSVSPLPGAEPDRALLVLEDLGEVMELRSLVPICAQCKKIRQDDNYWHSVESYIQHHMDLDFTHSLCPDCFEAIISQVPNPAPRKAPPA